MPEVLTRADEGDSTGETQTFDGVAESVEKAAAPKAFDCPHCKEKIFLHHVASIPDKQIFTVTLESETGSFSARTVGETITNLDKLMKAVAKDIGGKVEMFVDSIEKSGNALKVAFLVTSVAQRHDKPSHDGPTK